MVTSLSDLLLNEMSAERSDALLIELGEGIAINVPQSTNVIVHFILEGEVTIEVEKMEQTVTLRQGEYGLLYYGSRHRIYVGCHEPPNREHLIKEWPAGDEPPTLNVGRGTPAAKLISAALRLIHNPVKALGLHAIPELLPLQQDAQRLFVNAALLTDTTKIAEACHGPGAA